MTHSLAGLLSVVIVLLLLIFFRINDIACRLKDRFPTERERDADWAQKDPMGHWEAHNKPK